MAFASNTFTDVDEGRYYTDAVQWAADNGVTTGTSATTFSPENAVTRAQNVTFAYRYDQNVVQPALDNITTDVITAQTTADGAQTAADVLGERVDAPGQRVALLQWWQETITVGNSPFGVAFDGTHIWTANYSDSTVSKIVAATGAVDATIGVGDGPLRVAFDGTHIWVTNASDDTVSKIVAATGTVAATIDVGNEPRGVAFDGTHIWTANNGDNSVSKIPVG